jgi:cephalosporin hydroxylase
MSDPYRAFRDECREMASSMSASEEVRRRSLDWINATAPFRYTYNFEWLGRPIIQFPQDMVAMQEIIWRVRPDVVVETGVAHGGSLVFYASLLELLGGSGIVVGIDVEVRPHNRDAIEQHPLARRIRLVEGSSTDDSTLAQVRSLIPAGARVLVALDSNHTHQHVLRELQLYSPLVTPGSYLVVFDTIVEDMPEDSFPDRPWGRGDNPATAVREFLASAPDFSVDREVEDKLLITVAPGGYLRRAEGP